VDIGALGRLAARWPTRRRRRGSAECGQLTRAPLSQAELVAPRSCITMQTLLMPSASNRCTRGAEREQAGALRLEAAPPAHRPRHEAALFVLGALRVRAPGGLPGELCGPFPPALSCCGGGCAAYRGADECLGGVAGVGEHGVVVAGSGECVRAFVEDGELSAEALGVGGSGLSRGGDDPGSECLLVGLDHSGNAGQGSGCFDRGVVEGAAAEDDAVRLEWFEDS